MPFLRQKPAKNYDLSLYFCLLNPYVRNDDAITTRLTHIDFF